MLPRQTVEPLDRRVQELGIGREGDRLRLHRGMCAMTARRRRLRGDLGPRGLEASLMCHFLFMESHLAQRAFCGDSNASKPPLLRASSVH